MNNDTTTPSKICTKCHIEYPATTEYFHKEKLGKLGLRSHCIPCIKASKAARYEANPDKARSRSAAWRKENPDKTKASNAAWRKQNPQKCKAHRANWQKAHAERMNLYHAQWRKENPDRAKAHSAKYRKANREKAKARSHRRRAYIATLPEHFTAADLRLQYKSQKGLCWHCFCELNGVYHVDHLIPLAQGGSNAPDNIVCSCAPCNLSKGDKTMMEWKGTFV